MLFKSNSWIKIQFCTFYLPLEKTSKKMKDCFVGYSKSHSATPNQRFFSMFLMSFCRRSDQRVSFLKMCAKIEAKIFTIQKV